MRIQRRDNGAWQLPGGVLELNEAIEDGMRREVEEETGVKVERVRLTGVYKNMKLGALGADVLPAVRHHDGVRLLDQAH